MYCGKSKQAKSNEHNVLKQNTIYQEVQVRNPSLIKSSHCNPLLHQRLAEVQPGTAKLCLRSII